MLHLVLCEARSVAAARMVRETFVMFVGEQLVNVNFNQMLGATRR